MSFLDHPSLKPGKKRKRPLSSEVVLKALEKDPKVPEKYKRYWKAGNEERMLKALERFGSLQMRVKFELLEEDEEKRVGYKVISGRTLVFKKVRSQGSLLGIIDALTDSGVEEAKKWTRIASQDPHGS